MGPLSAFGSWFPGYDRKTLHKMWFIGADGIYRKKPAFNLLSSLFASKNLPLHSLFRYLSLSLSVLGVADK
jgi:hypothetical protein